ncbi:phosphatase PAP2 family protein [Candidatus Saccharibacteria bacterium]|nr:phosphatase PAP2 family protein [Candidatus Saccharibacteria bacterium]
MRQSPVNIKLSAMLLLGHAQPFYSMTWVTIEPMLLKFKKLKIDGWQLIGIIGALAGLGLFAIRPSFPTPDKLIIFLIFVFMAWHQARDMLRRLGPFLAIILVYESFRGWAHSLNDHVNYSLAPSFDRWLFGDLPTKYLQDWWWSGRTRWHDVLLYTPYMFYFIAPFALAILIWKTRLGHYWQVITAYSLLYLGAFMTYFAFPAAPPWLAAQDQVIEPVTRVSSEVWASLGIKDFPSVYNVIAANPVAAVPSLHAGASTLFCLLIFKFYGWRWGSLAALYPLLIYIGTVYEGEHYFFDIVTGAAYGIAAFLSAPWATRRLMSGYKLIMRKHESFKT